MSGSLPALLTCLVSTLYGVGMIWTLQLNHYPLYADVPPAGFGAYIKAHNARLFLPIVLPSLIALGSSLWLAVWPPAAAPRWVPLLVLGLHLVIMASTVLIQGPGHAALARDGHSLRLIERIVMTNWTRTIAWSVNGGLLLWITVISLRRT